VLTDTILKGDHLSIISAKFGWDWLSSFRGEISSNGQNCYILSQKVPKFELYKHNDELFNIYYRIFLWTLNFYQFWRRFFFKFHPPFFLICIIGQNRQNFKVHKKWRNIY
jgi:hypothetical protein